MKKTEQITFEIHQENDKQHQVDARVMLVHSNQNAKSIHPQLDQEIEQLQRHRIFVGNKNEIHILPTYGLITIPYLVLVGLGDAAHLHDYREAMSQMVKMIRKYRFSTIEVDLTSFQPSDAQNVNLPDLLKAMTEGIILGNYRFKTYQQRDAEQPSNLKKMVYLIDQQSYGLAENVLDIQQAIQQAEAFAYGTNYARDLTNLPSNVLVPQSLAEEAQKLSDTYGFTCEILDEQEIVKRGMGGLYSVGKGSQYPPRMIVMKYQGLDEWTDVLGLVGKGITFDTGGISLKKALDMDEMIGDMGGAATVMGVMRAVGELRPKGNIVAVIPAAENMPSGSAYKPGDIITTMSGKTVEVLNTDAEGRIILADAITYAKQLGASKLIEISTLTGAVIVALGDVATGAVTNDEAFLNQFLEASHQTGEKIWQLPAFPEYWEMIKSPVADVRNSAGRYAGAITAALFVGTFAEQTPWIHLDIGGTGWLTKEQGVHPKRGTGVMVRTILQWICR